MKRPTHMTLRTAGHSDELTQWMTAKGTKIPRANTNITTKTSSERSQIFVFFRSSYLKINLAFIGTLLISARRSAHMHSVPPYCACADDTNASVTIK